MDRGTARAGLEEVAVFNKRLETEGGQADHSIGGSTGDEREPISAAEFCETMESLGGDPVSPAAAAYCTPG